MTSTNTNSSSSASASASAADATSNPPHYLLQNGSSGGGGAGASSSSRPARAGVGGGGGQNQACAACKYQRRKCNKDCPLARYFPADQQRRFLHAHRLFGVSNIQKTLRRTPPELRPDAMRALIFEAEARAADPVGGAYRVAVELSGKLNNHFVELAAVQQQLELCRGEAAASGIVVPDPLNDPAAMLLDAGAHNDAFVDALYGGQQAVGQAAAAAGVVVHDNVRYALRVGEEQPPPPPQQQQQLYGGGGVAQAYMFDGTSGDESSSHAWTANVVVDNPQHYVNGDGDVAAGDNGAESTAVGLVEQLRQHCQIEAAPFMDALNNVKPELPTMMMEDDDDGNHDLVEQPEEKVSAVAAAPSSSAAAAQCHLGLGFSSYS